MAEETKGVPTYPKVGPVGEMQRAIARAIALAISSAVAAGRLPTAAIEAVTALGDGHMEVPRDAGHGDLASTAPLRLAGACRQAPRHIAEEIQASLELGGLPVVHTEIAGAGFLNFHLRPGWLSQVVADIREKGASFGRSDLGRGEAVQVEFVSANPTGPLGVVNARAAAVGDALASVLAAVGFAAQREYYINDTGGQVERLGRSVEARWLELQGQEGTIPEGGYRGEYIIEIARAYEAAHGEAARGITGEQRAAQMGRYAVERMVAGQRACLDEFGVRYDVWYSQDAHIDQPACDATLADLGVGGHTYRKDGAVWLRTSTFGDDKDRVLVKRTGEPTYFLADIAYHRDKFARGFRKVIDLWGPDHHGHVGRMKAAVAALGHPPDAVEILIVQWVRLLEGGQPARMSKRRGQIVPMEDLIGEVGVDAARFFFLLRSHDSHLDFDLDLAKQRSSDSPVYYVQYAHARILSILRQPEAVETLSPDGLPGGQAGAAAGGPAAASPPALRDALELLTEPAEVALIRQLADFPDEVAGAAFAREPHRLTRYAMEVATAFHRFYDTCRVLTDDPALRLGRLALADATRVVLANTLGLLGVSAPDRM